MKKILCVSDSHCGCHYSIMPARVDEMLLNGDIESHFPNDMQKLLFDEWKKMTKDVGKVDMVFNLGDNTEGPNHKNRGEGNWTTDIDLQATAAAQLLSMIKTKRHCIVKGSGYHVGLNNDSETLTAQKIRNMTRSKVDISRQMIVNVRDRGEVTRIHLLHKTSVSRNQYATTGLASQMMRGALKKGEIGKIDGYIRGHGHNYKGIDYAHTWGFEMPCWKITDDFLATAGLDYIPKLGYILLEINGKDVSIRKNILEPKDFNFIMEVEL